MRSTASRWKRAAGAAAIATALGWAGIAQAQLGGITGTVSNTVGTLTDTVGGVVSGGTGALSSGSTQAAGVTAVVSGVVTNLAGSGTVSDPSQPAGSGQAVGSIPGVLSAETLHSAAMAWTDQAASQASLSNLVLTVAGIGISADFLGSEAFAGAMRTGFSAVEGLRIGGVPVSASGAPNQAVSVPGLTVILNEQTQTASGIVVNALRVRTLDGLTDVALGTSRAGI